MVIELHQEFPTFADFKLAVANWSVAEKFAYRIHKTDRERVSIKCRVLTCPFSIYAVYRQHSENIQVTSISSHHTCIGEGQFQRKASSKHDWLVKNIPKIMVVDNNTTPRAIIQAVQHHFHESITQNAASKAKHTLIRSTLSSQKLQFQQFPRYIQLLDQSNPGVYAHLALEPQSFAFQRIFICPQTSRATFTQCRPFVALDGTFTKTHFVQVLLLAVTIDAENHAVLLAWAMVESETEAAWRYFLTHLRQAIPEVNDRGVTIMSDRDKGLQSADMELPHAYRGYCTQHIKENIQRRFGLKAREMFATLAGFLGKDEFEKYLTEIQTYNPDLKKYILEIDTKKWSPTFFPGRTYGHHTSNIAESINAKIWEERRLPCLELLDALWNKVMHLRFRRLEESKKYHPQERFTKYSRDQLTGGYSFSN